jgi:hypothetical protein
MPKIRRRNLPPALLNHLLDRIRSREISAEQLGLTGEELRVVKLGVDSRLTDDDDDPALLASLKEAIAYADAHPDEAKSIDEVRALIPQWISESKSQTRQ